MRRISSAIALVLGCLLLTTPAYAFNFALLAQQSIKIENGPVTITGDVGVNNPGGSLFVGAHNQINGTAIADSVFLGTASQVTTVETNSLSGPGTAGSQVPPPSFPFLVPFPSVPPVPNCVNTAAPVNVASNASQTIPPGCYGDVRVFPGGALNLSAGGTYNFKTVRLQNGSTLASAGGTADVNVAGLFVTEPSANVTNIDLSDSGTQGIVVSIGNNSQFTGTITAPNAGIHLHNGTLVSGEVIGNTILIEPSMITVSPPSCCPTGQECKPI